MQRTFWNIALVCCQTDISRVLSMRHNYVIFFFYLYFKFSYCHQQYQHAQYLRICWYIFDDLNDEHQHYEHISGPVYLPSQRNSFPSTEKLLNGEWHIQKQIRFSNAKQTTLKGIYMILYQFVGKCRQIKSEWKVIWKDLASNWNLQNKSCITKESRLS